jgi:hypothetical protein
MTKVQTRAYMKARAYFCAQDAVQKIWIFDLDGNKLHKFSVFDKEFEPPKNPNEDYTPDHQVRLELIISQMCPDYLYKNRCECDCNFVDAKINQDEYEKERIEVVVKDRMNNFLRKDSSNSTLFENKHTIETILQFGIEIFDNYKEIRQTVNQ